MHIMDIAFEDAKKNIDRKPLGADIGETVRMRQYLLNHKWARTRYGVILGGDKFDNYFIGIYHQEEKIFKVIEVRGVDFIKVKDIPYSFKFKVGILELVDDKISTPRIKRAYKLYKCIKSNKLAMIFLKIQTWIGV